MQVTEVSLLGVRGFSPSLRLSLTPGYNVLQPSSGEAVPFGVLLAAMLHPEGWSQDGHLAAADADAAKVALGLLGGDQLLYRVLRQLGTPGVVQRLPRGTPAPEVLAQDVAGAQRVLHGPVGAPARALFEQLCILHAAQRPSARPRTPPLQAGAYAGPGLSGPVLPASDVDAARSRAAALEAELVSSQEVEALQFQADGLSNELFNLEARLRAADGPREALAQAERAWQQAPDAQSLGLAADLEERIARYPQAVKRREEALERLAAEREPEEELAAPGTPEPPWKEQRFWLTVAAGVVLLGAAMLGEGSVRYLALLGIPVFGFAALLGLGYVERLQELERSGRKGSMAAARERKIEEEFQREVEPVRRAMQQLDVGSPTELAELLGRRALLEQRMEGLRAQLAQAESAPEYVSARSDRERMAAEQDRLNARLAELGSYVRDPRDVERELARVNESIALALAGSAPGAPGGFEDPCPALLSAAATLLGTDVPTVCGLLRDRLPQYLAALTDKRHLGVEFSTTGAATVISATGKTPAGNLPGRDLDLLYLALRLTLAEKAAAKVKAPLIIEGIPPGIEETKTGLLGRMLKHLGTHTQVLHVTPHPSFATLADLTVGL